mgnify:CR=1 FL=1
MFSKYSFPTGLKLLDEIPRVRASTSSCATRSPSVRRELHVLGICVLLVETCGEIERAGLIPVLGKISSWCQCSPSCVGARPGAGRTGIGGPPSATYGSSRRLGATTAQRVLGSKKGAIHHSGKTKENHDVSNPLFGPFWLFFGSPGPFASRSRTPRDILTRSASISANLDLWEAISDHFLVFRGPGAGGPEPGARGPG